jgi:hypothetical protein
LLLGGLDDPLHSEKAPRCSPYIADFSVLNYIRASVPDHFGGAASDWLSRAERLHDIFSGSRGPEGLPLKRAE